MSDIALNPRKEAEKRASEDLHRMTGAFLAGVLTATVLFVIAFAFAFAVARVR